MKTEPEAESKPELNVTLATWKLRIVYLAFFAGLGSLVPYLPILLTHRHFSPLRIGLLLSINPIVGILLPPLWGAAADRTGRTAPLLRLQLLVLPILVIILYHSTTMIAIAGTLTALAMFLTAFPPLADHLTLDYAHQYGIDYGRVRVFGSIGFSLANLSVTAFLQHGSIDSLWLLYTPFVATAFLVAWTVHEAVPRDRPSAADSADSPSDDPPLSRAASLRPLLLFYLIILCLALTMPAFYTFFPLYVSRLPGGAKLLPFAYVLSSGSEIFTIPFATLLYNRSGPRFMLILSAVSYAARWVVVALSPWTVLTVVVQILHGISFGFFYTSSVMYIRNALPKRMFATGQGLFGATTALGSVLGNILGGLLYESETPRALFLTAAAICLAAAILMWLHRKLPAQSFGSTR